MNNTIQKTEKTFNFLPEQAQCEFESCVFCNKLTNVPKALHIDFRSHYIEGVGQLCFVCYTKGLNYNYN